MAEQETVLVNLATGLEDAERVTVAFLVANAALDSGRRVAIWTTKEAVRIALKGFALGTACDGCPPVERLFEQFQSGGSPRTTWWTAPGSSAPRRSGSGSARAERRSSATRRSRSRLGAPLQREQHLSHHGEVAMLVQDERRQRAERLRMFAVEIGCESDWPAGP